MVHYQDVVLHLVLPDCLVVTETTGIDVLAVTSSIERIRGDFFSSIVSARGDFFN